MFKVTIREQKIFDEETSTFYDIPETTIRMEHSLLAVAKWESKWKVPFLSETRKQTPEEILDYIRCMCIDEVDPVILKGLGRDNITQITDYMNDEMTATWISDAQKKSGGKKSGKAITSELIYYYMSALHIPFDCEKWNLRRLIMLIEVASLEQQPPKKMPKADNIAKRNSLNQARLAKMRHH
jgi:hypothetical protein